MSNWYSEGTISLVNGSKTVTGAGTAWLENVAESNGLDTPVGLKEIESVTSNTALELVRPYAGPTVNNLVYSIIPTQGVAVSLVKKVVGLLSISGAVKDAFASGQLAKTVDLNKRVTLTQLAAALGVELVGYDGGNMLDIADGAKTLQDYTALRAYTGRAKGVRITTARIAGTFERDAGDTTSADNGGTVIVDGSGRRWRRLFAGAANVVWFGADPTGGSVATTAIRAAIAYSKVSGVGLTAPGDANFNLGGFPTTTGETKFLIDFDNFHFEPNNCRFFAAANLDPSLAARYVQVVFAFQDASNGYLGDFRCDADVVERTGTQNGVLAVALSSVLANARNIQLGTITGSRLFAVLACFSSNPTNFRYRSVKWVKLQNDGGYYTLNCSENGDGFSGDIYSNNVVRSYFVYGVDGQKVNIHSTAHFKFTDVVVKRYTRDTKNIEIFYTGIDDNSGLASVSIEHQNDSDDGLIQNVFIKFSVKKSSVTGPTLNFAAFTSAGATRAAMNSRTDNVHVQGVTNSAVPTTFSSGVGGANGENISRLYIQKHLLAGVTDYRRYIVMDGERRMVGRSDAAGGMAIKLNVSEYKFTPNWGVLTVWGANNPGADSSEFIIRQYFVLFSVASNGAVSVITATAISTQTAGTLGPTVTFPAQTGTFNLELNVNNYTNANRQCSATLEVFRLA